MKKVTQKFLVAMIIVTLLMSKIFLIASYAVDVASENVEATLSAVTESGGTLSSLTGKIGIQIGVTLKNGEQVDKLSADLHYDKNVLSVALDEYEEPEITTVSSTRWSGAFNDDEEEGVLSLLVTRSAAKAVQGTICTVYFNVKPGTTVTQTTVTLDYADGLIDFALTGDDIWANPVSLTFPEAASAVKLTLDANGGKIGDKDTVEIEGTENGTSTINQIPETTATGYTVTFDDGNGASSSVSPMTQTKSFDSWTHTGGGSFDSNSKVYTFGTTDGTLTANYKNDAITLPEASQVGKTFVGWYAADDESTIYAKNTSYTPTDNITLYAKYTDISYTLKVNPNGGTFTYEGNDYTTNVEIPGVYNKRQELANPVGPAGHTVTFHTNYGEDVATPTTTTTSFDTWENVSSTGSIVDDPTGTFKIYIFGSNDGEIKATYTQDAVTMPTYTRDGYTLSGFATTATGTTAVTTPYVPTGDVDLYAIWTPDECTITFNPGEGSLPEGVSNTRKVNYDAPYGTLPTPTRAGYDFDKWVDPDNHEVKADDLVKGDITLTAVWLGAEYTVNFDYNGGTGSTPSKTVRNEGLYGDLPTPDTRVGYRFVGWFTDATNGDEIKSTTQVNLSASQTLYAHYEDVNTKVTANLNGGKVGTSTDDVELTGREGSTQALPTPTHDPRNIKLTVDSDVTVTSNTLPQSIEFDDWEITKGNGTIADNATTGAKDFTFGSEDTEITAKWKYGKVTLPDASKPGHTFDGWYTPDGTKVGDKDEEVNIGADVTELVPHFTADTHKITVKPNGGKYNNSEDDQDISGAYGTTTVLAEPVGPKGHTVTVHKNDGTTDTVDSTVNKKFTGWTYAGTSFDTNSSTYTFTNTDEEITANYAEAEVTLPTLTRTGYTLSQFNTKADGTGTTISNKFTPEDNTEVYAIWTANKYDITLDPNGGELAESERTVRVTYDSPFGSLPTPTKEGNKFLGWYLGDTKIEADTIVKITGPATLVAHWEPEKYKVTFLNDDNTTVLYEGEVEYNKNATFDAEIPTSTIARPGYRVTFDGWDNEDDLINVKGPVTVKAKYTTTLINYTIKYNNTKNQTNSNPTSYTVEDADITLQDLADTETQQFLGWYTDPGETGTKVTSIQTANLENITLYAHWTNDHLYLSSEKYKIGLNDIDNYEAGDVYIDKIEPNTTVEDFIEKYLDTNGTVKVYYTNGDLVPYDKLVGTGMKVIDTGYGEEFRLTAVVMGDTDGDGKVTATDLADVKQVLLKTKTLEEPYFLAADQDENKKISATDLADIRRVILRVFEFKYTKPNKTSNE